MSARCPECKISIIFAFFLLCSLQLTAATAQVPEWFRLTAELTSAPELNQAVDLRVNLQAIIGQIASSQIRLILPEAWKTDPEQIHSKNIKEGETFQAVFKVTPGSYLSQGSIVVEAVFQAPKGELITYIGREMPEQAADLSETVRNWPDETKRYADISFALTPEETFYPVSGDMWLSYDDRLVSQKGFRGPAFYEDPLITAHQAQTDVEMFSKLEGYLKADQELLANLKDSGIDINRKRYDQLNGLYVLAVKAYLDNSLDIAGNFVEQFDNAVKSEQASAFENLRIAAGNIKGLIYWGKGQRRLAEDAFKKIFYSNRKHPLQRYILRNLGLLMFAGGDRATAAEMFRLARGFKDGYTLLENESELLGKN
ncbi:MAG: hypothetical protein CVV41_14540 [Candidatus Riflebacteria bacterium HGW-Riflebacteria-1]|jgi:hypothetical protein|nr:MAG: hypothetical protein CVV41_14540 [Candidatus Riflebacteria bacterium HGW-Riflebacteria-1]